jgi:hypothetical protein
LDLVVGVGGVCARSTIEVRLAAVEQLLLLGLLLLLLLLGLLLLLNTGV